MMNVADAVMLCCCLMLVYIANMMMVVAVVFETNTLTVISMPCGMLLFV